MAKLQLTVAAALFAALSVAALGNAPVEAVGLFKDRAMIRVMGTSHYLVVGQTSPEGARLEAANAEFAMVHYQGTSYRLTLSDRVGGTFAEVRDASISIAPDDLGQYRVGGAINGRTVGFLVDTGASVVAMSSVHAEQLGIEYEGSPDRAQVMTAQGQAQSYLVNLESVNVGGIETHHVRAAVIPGAILSRCYSACRF
ncbi:MAG: TIGR02281 family clan AA aspartic protease [Gammaproteobacteria bacterium]|nr:TIGR02281 family clan AA aspartic protease [Gammaproteobacteria bacterium]